jgi:ribosomal protein L16/L10AE
MFITKTTKKKFLKKVLGPKFKRRSRNSSKITNYIRGDAMHIFNQESRIELKHLAIYKKILKRKRFKINWRLQYFLQKVWFNLTISRNITERSKNARMGKGKSNAKFLRCIYFVAKNTTLNEFAGYSMHGLMRIGTIFKKRTTKSLLTWGVVKLRKNSFNQLPYYNNCSLINYQSYYRLL